MPKVPERKLAPHVQAAVSAGAQAKMRPAEVAGGPRRAAHVQAALAAIQPKLAVAPGTRRGVPLPPPANPGAPGTARRAARVEAPAVQASRAGSGRIAPPPLPARPRVPGVAQPMLPSGALFDMKKNEMVKESGFTPNSQQQKSGRYWLDEHEGKYTWWYLDRGPDLTDPGHLIVGGFMRNPEDFWQDEGGDDLLAQEWHHMDPYESGMAQAPGSYTPMTPHDPLTRKGTIDEETVKESVLWWYDKLSASGVKPEQLANLRSDMKGKWNLGMGAQWWESLRQRMIRYYHKNYWLPQLG